MQPATSSTLTVSYITSVQRMIIQQACLLQANTLINCSKNIRLQSTQIQLFLKWQIGFVIRLKQNIEVWTKK